MGSTHLIRLLLLRIIGRRKCEGAWRGGWCSQLTSIKKDVVAIDWLAQCDTHMRAAPRERDSTTPFRIPRIGNQILLFLFLFLWPSVPRDGQFSLVILRLLFFGCSFWFCLLWRAVCVIDHSEDRRVRFGLFVRGGKGSRCSTYFRESTWSSIFHGLWIFELLEKSRGIRWWRVSVVVSFPVMSSNLEELDVSQAALISSFVLTFLRSFVRARVGWVFIFISLPGPFCLFFSFHYSPLSGRYCVASGEKK
jgi:hypothetical protein